MIKSSLPPVYAIQNADGTYWGPEGPVADVNNAILHRTPWAAGLRLENACKKIKQTVINAKVVTVDAKVVYSHEPASF